VKSDNESLESTLDRHMGRAGKPPAGQVASSVEEVWERLRPEAEHWMPPVREMPREMAPRRSHFAVAAAVVVVTVAIGLYALRPVQQRSPLVEQTVYTLVVAKNGSKLQKAEDERRDARSWGGTYYNPTGPGQITFSEKTTLRSWTHNLEGLLEAPVVDQTGLNGTYSFSLEFTDPRDSRPRQADSPPDLFTAVREQLGLELRATKRRV
jgi:hypothetical protein